MSAGQPQRVEWVDVAKGIAILLVTLFHADMVLGWEGYDTGFSADANKFLQPIRMPLFFTVSGIFAASAIAGTWSNLWNKRISLYIWLFLVWSTIYWLFAKFNPVSYDPTFGQSVIDLIKSIIRPIVFIWFLWVLAVFFISAKLLRNIPSKVVLVLTVFASVLGFFLSSIKSDNSTLKFVVGSLAYLNALRYFCFFWFAATYRHLVIKHIPHKTVPVLALVAAFVILQVASYINDVTAIDAFISFSAAVCAVLVMLSFSQWVANRKNLLTIGLSYLGKNTIPLYV
ncbi:MAG: hypothetical protein EOO38_06015, partial [Cytophagaceae bacterium]